MYSSYIINAHFPGCIYFFSAFLLAVLPFADLLSLKVMTTCIRSKWKLPLRGQITYRHCWQPKFPNFLYSSNLHFGGWAADVGNATPTFFFSVPAMVLRLYSSVCRQYYSDFLLQCAGDIEADHTDSGIVMDCADQNWWSELTTTTSCIHIRPL